MFISLIIPSPQISRNAYDIPNNESAMFNCYLETSNLFKLKTTSIYSGKSTEITTC